MIEKCQFRNAKHFSVFMAKQKRQTLWSVFHNLGNSNDMPVAVRQIAPTAMQN